MSTNVGLLTEAGAAPKPRAIPRTSAVLPAPSGPTRASISPPRNPRPIARPRRSVSRADEEISFQSLGDRLPLGRRGVLINEAVALLLAADFLKGIRNMCDDITGQQADLAEFLRGEVSSCSMDIRGGTSCIPSWNTLSQKTVDHACQHISGPCGRHAGIAGWTDCDQTV